MARSRVFTTQTASTQFALPDGRGYEMVSPPQKDGARISTLTENTAGTLIEAAPAGGALTYVSTSPTESGVAGYVENAQLLSTRAGEGWSTRDLSLPHEQATTPPFSEGSEYRRFSSDLSGAIVQPYGLFTPCLTPQGASQPCLSPAASEQTAFSDDLQTGLYMPLVSGCPAVGQPCPPAVAEQADVPPGTVFGGHQLQAAGTACAENEKYCGPYFVAATPDLSHVVLLSATPLTEGEGAGGGLYEYSAGKLTFIGQGEHEGKEGHFEGADAARMAHGISTDGSRVIFNGKSDNPNHEPVQGLLMRDTSSEETVLLGEHGEFQTASASQSRIFFTEGGDLKVCEVVAGAGGHLGCELSDLTPGAGVLGDVLGSGEDGSYVYFVSTGVLGDAAGAGAVKGADNLYVNHYDDETGAWQPVFVTTLTSLDFQDWLGKELEFQPTRVSPDGQWLAFMSDAQLTDYDNREATGGDQVAEAYLYHAATGGQPASLTCASCLPTGERPTGVEQEKLAYNGEGGYLNAWPDVAIGGELPGWEGIEQYPDVQPYQARYLTDQGRLFFNATDPLVPLDSDGTADVYQYEPEGVPSGEHACSSASTSGSVVFEPARSFTVEGRDGQTGAGCVGLISSGDSGQGSAFLDASEDGSEVFFLTNAQLSPTDQDTASDVYVARECTSASPCLSQPVSPPECDNEASCKPSPEPQPSIYGVGPSETFSGPGDLAPSSSPLAKPVVKQLTPAQKLARALKACRKKKGKKRAKCEKQARSTYGSLKKANKAKKAGRDQRTRR